MDNLRGAILMVCAMFFFAVEDAFIKFLASDFPVGQILAVISGGAAIGFAIYLRLRGMPIWHNDYLHPKVLMRSGVDVVGSLMFSTALALIPLTTASAVLQATPIVVAMGAAIFLGQEVGWRRWIAIFVGFCGVMLIVRPGMEGFTPSTLLAVGGMLCLASRDLITRSLNLPISGPQLSFHVYTLMAPAGIALALLLGQEFVMPNGTQAGIFAVATVFGMGAYLLIVAATRAGNAGIISSFRYSRMVFALTIGYVVFAERPDAPTLIGAAIVIGSGIYTLLREARLARPSKRQKPAL